MIILIKSVNDNLKCEDEYKNIEYHEVISNELLNAIINLQSNRYLKIDIGNETLIIKQHLNLDTHSVNSMNITIEKENMIMYGEITEKRDDRFMHIIFKSNLKNFFNLSGWM